MMTLTYTIRESHKAKHVSLKISTSGSLEVIVPPGFDRDRIPAILQKKQRWIDRVTQRIENQQACLGVETAKQLPQEISLPAIAEDWRVEYTSSGQFAVRATEHPNRRLVLQGEVENRMACQSVLQGWISYKARAHLAPWLETVSRELELPFESVAVRQQKTLWGSCSARKRISLNCKLLFLPHELVRYVLIHELCHTVHLNHSADFWAFVERHEPNYQSLDRSLRDARYCVPVWMEA